MTIDSTRFNYFDASLISKSDLKLLEKVDSAFDRMFKEIAIVGEYERQNKLHLVEFALSKRTRKVLNELKHKEIQFTTQYKALLEYIEEQEASAGDTTNDAADIGGNILKLINKFHTDNKKSIDTLSGEEKFKDFVPKNIGAEPSMWQKAKAKLQGVTSGDGNVIVKLLTAIVSGAMDKAEKFFSGLKGDLAAAWKGGATEVDSQGNPIIDPATGQPKKTADGVAGVFQYAMTSFGPSMTTVERGADGKLIYKKDTEATGFIDWLRKFVERNPKWTNIIIGFITNIAKIIALPFGGPMGSVIAGAVVGLILRTLVGRLKGESWAQAFKQAAIVVGLSLIAGAVFKGLVAWIRGGGFFAGIKSYFVGGDPVAAAKAAAADAKANAAGKAARKTAQAAEVQQFIDSRSRDAAQQLLKTTDSWQLRQLGSDIPDDAWRAAGWDNVPYQDGDKAEEFYRLVNNAKSGDQKYVDVVTKLIRSSPKLTNSIDYKELPPSSQRLIAGLVSGKPQLLNPKELQSAMLDAQAETAAQQQAAQGATATMNAGAAAVNAANFAKVSTDDITKLMATKGADTKLIDVIYKTPSLLKAFKEQASDTVQGGDVRTYIRNVADPEEIANIINKAGGLPKETLSNLAVKSANAAATAAIAPRYNWQPGTANQIAKSLGLGDKVAAYNTDKYGRVISVLNPQTREYVPVPTDMITSQDQLLKPGFGIKESSYKKMMKNIYL